MPDWATDLGQAAIRIAGDLLSEIVSLVRGWAQGDDLTFLVVLVVVVFLVLAFTLPSRRTP